MPESAHCLIAAPFQSVGMTVAVQFVSRHRTEVRDGAIGQGDMEVQHVVDGLADEETVFGRLTSVIDSRLSVGDAG